MRRNGSRCQHGIDVGTGHESAGGDHRDLDGRHQRRDEIDGPGGRATERVGGIVDPDTAVPTRLDPLRDQEIGSRSPGAAGLRHAGDGDPHRGPDLVVYPIDQFGPGIAEGGGDQSGPVSTQERDGGVDVLVEPARGTHLDAVATGVARESLSVTLDRGVHRRGRISSHIRARQEQVDPVAPARRGVHVVELPGKFRRGQVPRGEHAQATGRGDSGHQCGRGRTAGHRRTDHRGVQQQITDADRLVVVCVRGVSRHGAPPPLWCLRSSCR